MYDTRRVYIFFWVLYCNSNIFIRYTRMCWAKSFYVAPICVIYTGLYISYFYWAWEGIVVRFDLYCGKSAFNTAYYSFSADAREHVRPVPSSSILTWDTLPSSVTKEKRLQRTFPSTGATLASSRSNALVKSPHVSANIRTLPSAF